MNEEHELTESAKSNTISRRSAMQGIGGLAVAAALGMQASPGQAGVAKGAGSFREIEHTWIPMPDGVRLAARIWLPLGAERRPVPALFNYCPYFARLFTRVEDDARFSWFASHGYACVRVDIRGSGDSEGLPMDEYVRQEQDDGVEIIQWIAAQPWCSGAVGMEGLSWSGFNSLQVAARRPPALKAIMTHCSTDDRYADDAHFKGGCIINDNFLWGTAFFAIQGTPTDPEITGREGWRDQWLKRLNAIDFNLGKWLTHQHRDAFWKHGSVIEDYSQIACPVYAIGGWVDGYKNTVFRLLEGLKVPRKGLVGPWTHTYPHTGVPGPAIGYLPEALRWWDHWLKGKPTGIMDEPMLRFWMQDQTARPDVADVPGRWAAEDQWPSGRSVPRTFYLNASRRLESSSSAEEPLILAPWQTVGGASGNWCPSGAGTAEDLRIDLPLDQRVDDARSLVFDSAPLSEPLEFLGAPELSLSVAVDRPVAFVAIRLNEVWPDGRVERITYGILNLCHRDSHEHPTALQPGARYEVRLRLDHAAHRFRAGNAIRIAISTAYWPMVLPSPEPVTLTVFGGHSSQLQLPVRPPRSQDASLRAFEPPFVPPMAIESIESTPGSRIVEWDTGSQRQVVRYEAGNSVALLKAVNTRLRTDIKMQYTINDKDTAAIMESAVTWGWERDPWLPRIVATSRITTTPREFIVHGEFSAYDGKEKLLTRSWQQSIPRELV